jgi:hypothetical protein
MQAGDHLRQSAAPGGQRVGKQPRKGRLHLTLDTSYVVCEGCCSLAARNGKSEMLLALP